MSKEVENSDNENSPENLKTNKPVKKHFCPYVGCSYAFDRPWKLDRHLNVHTNERPFKCDYPGCTKGYTNNSHLQRHKTVTHSKNKPTPENIPCSFPECKKIFASKWSMKRHSTSHYTNNSPKIEEKETFKKSGDPKLENFHDWEEFICDTCRELFKTNKELNIHKKKHKVYPCDYNGCIKKFTSWNSLRTHSKTAHPDRYQCDFCKNFYKNKWTLTEHVLSHLPFEKRDVILCPFPNCGRHYFYDRNLEAHIKSYHHNLNYKCEIEDCGKIFTTKQKLKEHVRRHTEPTMKKKHTRRKLTPEEKELRRKKNPKKKKKSMAAALSGVVLPSYIDRNIAQNNITSEVLDYIEKIKNEVDKNSEFLEDFENISEDELKS